MGGRSQQLSSSPQGQEGFALYLRCALRAISILNCRFQHFGDGRSGGGGVILGPRPEAEGQGLESLRIEDCVFADNGNVPGLYIAACQAPGCNCRGISVNNNSFAGSVGSTKVQNCIYILGGGAQSLLRHVMISGNRFELDTRIDVAIELNWVDTFTLSGNMLHFQAVMPGSSGILIRDGCANGAIVGNVIVSDRADNDLRGILVLNFQHPGTITNLVISDNVVSGVIGAIGVDRGSTGVVVANNRISGSNAQASVGIRIVDASGVLVNGNIISAMTQAMAMGMGDRPASGLRNIVVEHNRFDRCGGDGQALIAAIVPLSGWAAKELLIRDNTAVDSVAGSRQIDPVFFCRRW
ncbi:right-handed parallel beta-helix repeat-containing protein [Magnetospirillum gryphiswaldense]|uniref:right-handed parallel beta-helix repeat-containing protein n=1 Tax=Magnetospirillum gryphiswaldense TaxID=55518 RepID=UPI001F579779|nr:right-handed parallel beta-helix repeat-containing protein [Magnetospirillum gryphiswaldense]